MNSNVVLRKRPRSNEIESRAFYTLSEIAKLLGIDEITLYRCAQSGELASYRIGGPTRFRGDDLKAFMRKRRRVFPRKGR